MINIGKYMDRRNILRVVMGLFIILAMFIAYDNLSFRIKHVSPSIDRIPSSALEIRYHFSQPIKSVGEVLVNGRRVNSIEISDKVLKIPFTGGLTKNQEYSIIINSIQSKWFNNNIKVISSNFTPQYIDFADLSSEEKRAQVDASSGGQVDDPFIAENIFPIFNYKWQIDATIAFDSRIAILNVKFFEEVPDYDNGGVIKRISNKKAEQYRSEVLKKIKDLGGDPNNYRIFYSNVYLRTKYGESSTH